MGRHSTGDQTSFYRSAALWFVPWTVGAVVAIAAIWIAVDALGNESAPAPTSETKKQQDKAPAAADESPEPSPTESEEPSPSPTPEESESPKADKKPDKPKLITAGVTVQILNGTSSDEADDVVADQLEQLGLDVAAINPYHSNPTSIVYWSSPEMQETGEALADKLGWKSSIKPAELSTEVDLHVYIGEDEG
jgi:hypothetical protein